MFQSLFRRAEVAIEHSVGQLVLRILVAVPFLIAAGFGTAALSLRLSRQFDPETANLLMAGLFVLIGAVVAIIVAFRSPKDRTTNGTATVETGATEPLPTPGDPVYSNADKELLMAAQTSAAPIALPLVSRVVIRNLPLIASIGAAIFVMTRPSPSDQHIPAGE